MSVRASDLRLVIVSAASTSADPLLLPPPSPTSYALAPPPSPSPEQLLSEKEWELCCQVPLLPLHYLAVKDVIVR